MKTITIITNQTFNRPEANLVMHISGNANVTFLRGIGTNVVINVSDNARITIHGAVSFDLQISCSGSSNVIFNDAPSLLVQNNISRTGNAQVLIPTSNRTIPQPVVINMGQVAHVGGHSSVVINNTVPAGPIILGAGPSHMHTNPSGFGPIGSFPTIPTVYHSSSSSNVHTHFAPAGGVACVSGNARVTVTQNNGAGTTSTTYTRDNPPPTNLQRDGFFPGAPQSRAHVTQPVEGCSIQ